MKNSIPVLFLIIAVLAFSGGPSAANGFLGFSLGRYAVFDGKGAADFRFDLRPHLSLLTPNLRPWAGLEVTGEGSLWAGGGLLYEIPLGHSLFLTPAIGAGYYHHGGGDTDLGHNLEFRSQLELSYAFTSGQRLGLTLSHLSNAGLGTDNPGAEILGISWQQPY